MFLHKVDVTNRKMVMDTAKKCGDVDVWIFVYYRDTLPISVLIITMTIPCISPLMNYPIHKVSRPHFCEILVNNAGIVSGKKIHI